MTHDRDRVYPATLEAETFTDDLGLMTRQAMSQDQFLELMKKVVQSPQVRASIESLIARSNDAKNPDAANQVQVEDDLPAA